MLSRNMLALLPLMAAGFIADGGAAAPAAGGGPEAVYVSIIGPGGKLTDPVLVPRVVRTDAEWKKLLTPEQMRITRGKGTERAFCGGLLKNKGEGVYVCIACGLPLFSSEAKFESGTGWPSFYQPIGWTNMKEVADLSMGMARTEIMCPRCDSHMGHVFEDGPRPTGLRYCLNSESLKFIAAADLPSMAETLPEAQVAQAVFSGGLSVGLEAIFEEVPGVVEAACGQATGAAAEGGQAADPADAVLVIYDPAKVDYARLVKIHRAILEAMPPMKVAATPKIRPAVFYSDDAQKQAAEKSATAGDKSPAPGVEKLADFKQAPIQKQNLAQRRPDDPYVMDVVQPTLARLAGLIGRGKE